jgi:two-component system, OmpR family, KDP operon response regulator KdpE
LPRLQVLLVGDDPNLIDPLTRDLMRAGLKAVSTCDTASAVRLAEAEDPFAVVLSLDLQARSGRDLLQEFARRSQTGLIVLGTSWAAQDVTLAFDLGAQSYLAQPFSFRELLARIRTLLRRAGSPLATRSPAPTADRLLWVDALILDRMEETASYAARPLRLTPKEFRILEQLLVHAGEVVTQRVLLQRGWGRYGGDHPGVLRVAVSRLRRKLREAGAPELLETRPGLGFILRPELLGQC